MYSYLELLKDVLVNGESHDDRTGVGTVSVFGRQWRHDLRQGFPILTTKKVPLRWVAEELRWFLSGSTDVSDLQKNGVDIWDEWATEEQCAKFNRPVGKLGPVYGALWRGFPVGDFTPHDHAPIIEKSLQQEITITAIDQITKLVADIQDQPNSRRLIVSGWHPYYQRRVALPPCHTLWQVKVHSDETLSLHLYARSIDSFLGLPFNIASYALLTHLLSAVCGLGVRELIISFGDLHIYQNHFAAVEEQLSREPKKLPRLSLNHRLWTSGIDGLLNWEWSDVILSGYQSHPKISAPVAV